MLLPAATSGCCLNHVRPPVHDRCTIEKLAFLLLGWLLGLLGPVIVESIKRKRENAMGRATILNELHELVGVLSIAAYGARMRHGSADRRFLEWLKGTLEQYATTTKLQEFIPRIRHWLSLTDDQLHQVARHTSASDGKRAMLQHYPVPLIDARVSAIWSFDTSFQRQLLAIRRIWQSWMMWLIARVRPLT